MHFLREGRKEKPTLLQSLIITSNNQRNKSSEKIPENTAPYFPLRENSNNIKEKSPPLIDDITDFGIDDTAIKSGNTEK